MALAKNKGKLTNDEIRKSKRNKKLKELISKTDDKSLDKRKLYQNQGKELICNGKKFKTG